MQYNQRQAAALLLGLSESKSQKVEGIGSLVVQNREQERKIALPSEKVSAPPPVRGGRGSERAERVAVATPEESTSPSCPDCGAVFLRQDKGRRHKRKDCFRFKNRRAQKIRKQAAVIESLQEAVAAVYLNAARTEANAAGVEAIAHLIHECCDIARRAVPSPQRQQAVVTRPAAAG